MRQGWVRASGLKEARVTVHARAPGEHQPSSVGDDQRQNAQPDGRAQQECCDHLEAVDRIGDQPDQSGEPTRQNDKHGMILHLKCGDDALAKADIESQSAVFFCHRLRSRPAPDRQPPPGELLGQIRVALRLSATAPPRHCWRLRSVANAPVPEVLRGVRSMRVGLRTSAGPRLLLFDRRLTKPKSHSESETWSRQVVRDRLDMGAPVGLRLVLEHLGDAALERRRHRAGRAPP